jgi:hypothetical protein
VSVERKTKPLTCVWWLIHLCRMSVACRAMVAYRLEVKTRIFREEAEVLSLYSNKPELRKEKLAEIYNELEQHYAIVIKKARLH